jgi:hypothetical protein
MRFGNRRAPRTPGLASGKARLGWLRKRQYTYLHYPKLDEWKNYRCATY